MATLQTVAEVPDLLREHHELLGRAVIATLEFAGDTSPDFRDNALLTLRTTLPPDAHLEPVSTDPGGRERLATLNTNRDNLLRTHSAVLLLVSEGESFRYLLRSAPDLTAHVDLSLRLEPAPAPLQGDALWATIAQAQRERHGQLRLTGLVPHHLEHLHFDLPTVYQPREPLPLGINGLSLWVGPPGAGKSLALRAVSVGIQEVASSGLAPARRLYVALSEWSAAQRSRTQRLLEWLDSYVGKLTGQVRVNVQAELPTCLLLLDGLDEVTELHLRRALLSECAQLVRNWPGLQIILSARDLVLEQLLAEHRSAWTIYSVKDLQQEEAVRLVDRLLRAIHQIGPTDGLPAEVDERRTHFSAGESYRNVHTSPLLLTFAVLLMELDRTPPTHKTALYHAIVEMLIVNWRSVRTGAQPERRWSRGEALKVLAPIGWAMVTQGASGLTREELIQALMAHDQLSATDIERRAAAERRFAHLDDDSALLFASDGRYQFHHQTLAEFLGARAALQSPKIADQLAKTPYNPQLAQTLAFALSLAIDIEPRDDLAKLWLDALEKGARRKGTYDAKIPQTLAQVLRECRDLPAERGMVLWNQLYRITFHQKLSPWQRMVAVKAWFSSALGTKDFGRASKAMADDPRAEAAMRDVVEAMARNPPDGGLSFILVLFLVSATRWPEKWISSANPSDRQVGWQTFALAYSDGRALAIERDPEIGHRLPERPPVMDLSSVLPNLPSTFSDLATRLNAWFASQTSQSLPTPAPPSSTATD